MTDLANEITEFARNVIAGPFKKHEITHEIQTLARITRAWPTATEDQWNAAIDEAVKRGLLNRESQTFWVPIKKVEAKPVQRELF